MTIGRSQIGPKIKSGKVKLNQERYRCNKLAGLLSFWGNPPFPGGKPDIHRIKTGQC